MNQWFQDILHQQHGDVAQIMNDRPNKYKALRAQDQSAHGVQYDGRGLIVMPSDEAHSEMWYPRRCDMACDPKQMELVNVVVPKDQFDAEMQRWCDDVMKRSPPVIEITKRPFNADTESIRGINRLGSPALSL